MSATQSLIAGVLAGLSLSAAAPAATPPRPAAAMERTEHQWRDPDRSSTFDAYWSGATLKMIREEMAPGAGLIEKNEYFFNAGTLLH